MSTSSLCCFLVIKQPHLNCKGAVCQVLLLVFAYWFIVYWFIVSYDSANKQKHYKSHRMQ